MGRAAGCLGAGGAARVSGDHRPKEEGRNPPPSAAHLRQPRQARTTLLARPSCAWPHTAPLVPLPCLLWLERLFLPACLPSAATRPRLPLPLLPPCLPLLLRRRRRWRQWCRCCLLLQLPLLLLLLSPSRLPLPTCLQLLPQSLPLLRLHRWWLLHLPWLRHRLVPCCVIDCPCCSSCCTGRCRYTGYGPGRVPPG